MLSTIKNSMSMVDGSRSFTGFDNREYETDNMLHMKNNLFANPETAVNYVLESLKANLDHF